MPSTTSALSSLLPLAGAVALTFQGIGRMRARRTSDRRPYAPPPQPKEIAEPDPRAARHRKAVPDTTCAHCGTSIPGRDTLCAPCVLALPAERSAGYTTALHWLALAALMAAVIGAGVLVSP